MALSPNYGFPEPDNSSLVKNGAQDIRALGDAVDTAVWNVGFGQAGKNKVINSDLSVNQRSFSSTTSSGVFTFDRWQTRAIDGTSTFTAQTFTPGAAPVAGYEGKNFIQIATTGQTATNAWTTFMQQIENVRTFAGQTITLSFWAKSATGTPSVAAYLQQNFGTGGSPSASVDLAGQKVAITSSWARYSLTYSMPSLSGKTIGTNEDSKVTLWLQTSAGTDRNAGSASLGIQTATISIWGVQLEAGAKMTPFQTASGGSPQAELAMCQRYYVRFTENYFGSGKSISTSNAYPLVNLPVFMRVPPTTVDFSTLALRFGAGSGFVAATNCTIQSAGANKVQVAITTAALSLISDSIYDLVTNGSPAFLGFGAEL
jgi:hypothetical protein